MSTLLANEVVQALTLTESEIVFYKREGYLPIPGLVRSDAVEALREEVFAVLEAHGLTRASLERAGSSADKLRQFGQYLAGSHLDALINGTSTLAVVSQLIGGKAVRYLPFTAVKSGGGGGQFHFHQDNNYTRHEPATGSINLWVALVDMMPENGCLMVVPRSHEQGQLDSRNSDDGDTHQQVDVDLREAIPIRMRAGDAVAFTRWTVHGSGENRTNLPRLAYALQYHRDDVTWLDRQTGQYKKLTDTPRWSTGPVDKLGPK